MFLLIIFRDASLAHVNGLVQDCRISGANALEIQQLHTEPLTSYGCRSANEVTLKDVGKFVLSQPWIIKTPYNMVQYNTVLHIYNTAMRNI